ncbi:MAG: nitrate reductase maturation protein NarM [Hydrococcus sp. SU_1_0]|nr:nitrate reductase maturation protein NarM [Hydrococcus sp. SU_1_0]
MGNIQPQPQEPKPGNKSDRYFQFEADFVSTLQCIPMMVRMKLDNCGVKLKLVHWNQFTQAERETLVDLPCSTPEECQTYREWIQNLIIAKTGKPAKALAIAPNPLWLNATSIPDTVITKAQDHNLSLSVEQWSNLNPAQRFALIKLSRPSHENNNFLPALQEFGIFAKS